MATIFSSHRHRTDMPGDPAVGIDRHLVHTHDLRVAHPNLEHDRRSLFARDYGRGREFFDAPEPDFEHVQHGVLADERHCNDRARQRNVLKPLTDVIDMPNKRVSLFVRLYMLNDGELSKKKREQFAEPSDEEIAKLEGAIREALEEYANEEPSSAFKP